MHRLLLVALLASCEPPLVLVPLPPLVRAAPAVALDRAPPQLIAGEHLAWQVHAHALAIGRATYEVATDGTVAAARFRTGRLASSFARVRYELTSRLDPRGVAIGSDEVVELDGRRTSTSVATGAHTIVTALAVVRGWAGAGAPPGFLTLAVGDTAYKLELGRPLVEPLRDVAALRVEGRVGAVTFTLWFADDAVRTPLRIEVRSSDLQITAELLATDA